MTDEQKGNLRMALERQLRGEVGVNREELARLLVHYESRIERLENALLSACRIIVPDGDDQP